MTMKNEIQNPYLLEVKNLKKYFPLKDNLLNGTQRLVRSVDDVSFYLQEGETLGLVGESGCGKSTTARAVLRLVEPTDGKVFYRGKDLSQFSQKELRNLRSQMQIIFQDSFASLNPRKKIGQILQEPFDIHGLKDKKEIPERVTGLLRKVGLSPDHISRYPHEFSGGQLQRIGIARAIALNPSFIVADEPVSSLDVSIRAQVINLLLDLKDSLGISYLFISHDMAVIKYFSDRVAVMYLGKIVELAESEQLYNSPRHPYTEALFAAIPTIESGSKKEPLLVKGDLPDAADPPKGCAFHTRCPIKEKRCEESIPELQETAPGHFIACFLRSS